MENKALKTTQRPDVYQQVTNLIIQQLEKGVIPWHKPWTGTKEALPALPVNYTTGNRYRGINILLLWSSLLQNDYQSGEWASFKQWSEKGEYVRKGEKGSLIIYYNTVEKEIDDELTKIPFIKTSYVFNREQLASFQPQEAPDQPARVNRVARSESLEDFISQTKAVIEHHHEGAFYIPSQDKIKMPYPEYFLDTDSLSATEGYYGTLTHELVHWSGHEKRLNRTRGKKFGDQNYAAEELVAEFGAAFLCAGFGIATAEKGNHAAYIDHWLKVLKENNRCIFHAASEASKAYDYLHGLNQPE